MEFSLKATTILTLDYNPKSKSSLSKHVSTEIELELSENVDKSHYIQEKKDGSSPLTKLGAEALTKTLIQGLVTSIHSAHEAGYWDSAEHLRYIISELERGFVQVGNVDFKSKS